MRREPFPITAVQRDRAVGALLATAAGDALDAAVPGEWTGNTATAIAVAELASFSSNLTALQRLEDLAARWAWWARTVNGVDASTVTCLTRAVPIALASLDPADERAAAHTARTLSGLTHPGLDATEAAALWTLAVRHAVLTGELDLRVGLPHLDDDRRDMWAARIADAEQSHPADTTDDTVTVLQDAWSAITTTAVPQQDPRAEVFTADHLRLVLEAAVRARGHTVAAVAGGLLGAAYGASALPWQWRSILRGWPGLRIHGLTNLAHRIVNGGEPCRVESVGFWREEPDPQRHPHDDGVWIGVAARLEKLPGRAEAVVSLCPVADVDMPPGVLHLEAPLDDANPNLDFSLLDTVRAIEALRTQGLSVFVHGHATRSRAPAVAALYGARRTGIDIDRALAEVCAVLPDADPTDELRAALHRLAPERSVR